MHESEREAFAELEALAWGDADLHTWLRTRSPKAIPSIMTRGMNVAAPTCDELAEEIIRRVPRLIDMAIHYGTVWTVVVAAWESAECRDVRFFKSGSYEKLSEALCRALIAVVKEGGTR